MIPDNLTPAEQQQLMQLAHREALLIHANAAFVPVEGEGGGEGMPESEQVAPEQPNVKSDRLPSPAIVVPNVPWKSEQVILTNGDGWWRGHDFTLTTEELKAVHKICAAAIAAKLTQEIERVRGNID